MIFAWVLLSVVVLLGVGIFIGACYFYKIAFVRFDRKKAQEKKGKPLVQVGKSSTFPNYWKESKAWFDAQQKQTLSIQSQDRLTLKASLLSSGDNAKTAIVIHGWTGSRNEIGSIARVYQRMGFSILAPDLRGHGESEGRFISFGWKDRKDILLWIEKAKALGAKQILITGNSMGGATTMMVAGEDLPKEVKCLVEDCGYTSVYDQFYDTLGKLLPSRLRFLRVPMMFVADQINYFKQGFHLKQASSVEQLKKAKRPVLFIHGDQDEFVPSFMQQQVFDACASKKEKLTVHGAEHCKSIAAEPALYEQTVRAFALKYIDI